MSRCTPHLPPMPPTCPALRSHTTSLPPTRVIDRLAKNKSVSGCPPDISNAIRFPRAAARWFWAHLFSSVLHAKMAGRSPEAPHYKTKPGAKAYAEGKRLWKNDDPVDRNLQGPN